MSYHAAAAAKSGGYGHDQGGRRRDGVGGRSRAARPVTRVATGMIPRGAGCMRHPAGPMAARPVEVMRGTAVLSSQEC